MISAILYLVGIALVVWVVFLFIDWVPVPQPFNKILKVVIMFIALIVLVNVILVSFGQRGFISMPALRG